MLKKFLPMLLVLTGCGDLAISRSKCVDFFNFEPNGLSIAQLLNRGEILHTDYIDYVLISTRGESDLNRLAMWAFATFGQNLVLLTHKTHSSLTQEIEEPHNMIIYQSEIFILLSQTLNMSQLQDLIWSDFQSRKGGLR